MRGNPSLQSTGAAVQPSSTLQTNGGAINPVGLTLKIAFPILVICAIVGYRKYQAILLRRRVKLLNHIWQFDALKK